MKIVAISDTHGCHDYLDVPKGDVLIHCGDAELCDNNRYNSFLSWFREQPHKHKLFVPGNHDFMFQEYQFNHTLEFEKYGINVLIDKAITINDIYFYGTPWTPTFMDWAFMKDDDRLKPHWDAIPENTDILITHGPAYDIGDCVEGTRKHLGSKTLGRKIRNLENLKYHFFGHIHTGKEDKDTLRVIWENTGIGFVNASVLNEDYKLVYPATIIDY